MPDLDEQLRSYFDALANEIVAETEASWALGTSDEHDGVLVPTSGDELSSTTTRNVVLLAAAMAVAIVGLYLALRAGSDDSAPVFIDEPETTIAPTTTAPSTTVPATTTSTTALSTVAVTWTEAPIADGPVLADFFGPWVAATPSGFLGVDEDRNRLWASPDGVRWTENDSLTALHGISIVDVGSQIIAFGTRTDDAEPVLLRSPDGEIWTNIDITVLFKDEALQQLVRTPGTVIAKATQNGLIWLSTPPGFPRDGVVAVVEDGRLVDAHRPPWPDDNLVNILEVGGEVVAFEFRVAEGPFSSYRYLGEGIWSAPMPIPRSSSVTSFAQVGDTVLMFDLTNWTCCSPIDGDSTWDLLGTTDGSTWTLVDTFVGTDVPGFQIVSGGSIGVIGAIDDTDESIEIGPVSGSLTLWVSRTGSDWEPVDVSFIDSSHLVSVVEDTIFLWAGSGSYWVGTLSADFQ